MLISIHIKKKIINKMKQQPTEWGKPFANHISDKGLISETYFKNHTTQQK